MLARYPSKSNLAMMEFGFYESLTGIYEIGGIKIYTELELIVIFKRCNRNRIDKTVLETQFSHLGLQCFGIYNIKTY